MRIESYRFGQIVIGGVTYTEDLLVLSGRVRGGWLRKQGHLLQLADLEEALAEKPEALIVGVGAHEGMKVASEVVAHTRDAGIELLAFDTRTACKTFNHLIEKRRVVAALHLTC
jgi:hypothetical protein